MTEEEKQVLADCAKQTHHAEWGDMPIEMYLLVLKFSFGRGRDACLQWLMQKAAEVQKLYHFLRSKLLYSLEAVHLNGSYARS